MNARIYHLTKVEAPTDELVEAGDCIDCGALTEHEISDGVYVCERCYNSEDLEDYVAGDVIFVLW